MDEKKLSRRNKKDLYIHRLVSVERLIANFLLVLMTGKSLKNTMNQ